MIISEKLINYTVLCQAQYNIVTENEKKPQTDETRAAIAAAKAELTRLHIEFNK